MGSCANALRGRVPRGQRITSDGATWRAPGSLTRAVSVGGGECKHLNGEREREGERTRGKMCQGKVGLRGSLAFSFFKIVSIPYLYADGSGLVESEKLMMEPCP